MLQTRLLLEAFDESIFLHELSARFQLDFTILTDVASLNYFRTINQSQSAYFLSIGSVRTYHEYYLFDEAYFTIILSYSGVNGSSHDTQTEQFRNMREKNLTKNIMIGYVSEYRYMYVLSKPTTTIIGKENFIDRENQFPLVINNF